MCQNIRDFKTRYVLTIKYIPTTKDTLAIAKHSNHSIFQ